MPDTHTHNRNHTTATTLIPHKSTYVAGTYALTHHAQAFTHPTCKPLLISHKSPLMHCIQVLLHPPQIPYKFFSTPMHPLSLPFVFVRDVTPSNFVKYTDLLSRVGSIL